MRRPRYARDPVDNGDGDDDRGPLCVRDVGDFEVAEDVVAGDGAGLGRGGRVCADARVVAGEGEATEVRLSVRQVISRRAIRQIEQDKIRARQN